MMEGQNGFQGELPLALQEERISNGGSQANQQPRAKRDEDAAGASVDP
jgi:hypothetical protein